jgi:hypothetical protein
MTDEKMTSTIYQNVSTFSSNISLVESAPNQYLHHYNIINLNTINNHGLLANISLVENIHKNTNSFGGHRIRTTIMWEMCALDIMNECECAISGEPLTNVIKNIHWVCTIEKDNAFARFPSVAALNVPNNSNGFIELESLTKETIIDWAKERYFEQTKKKKPLSPAERAANNAASKENKQIEAEMISIVEEDFNNAMMKRLNRAIRQKNITTTFLNN